MTNKLKELMELSNAVDVVCKAVDEDNLKKDERLKGKLADEWHKMWDDIETIIPVLEMLKPKKNSFRFGPYVYGYPYGYNCLGENGITFFVNANGSVQIYMDQKGGWGEIVRDMDVFDYWMRYYRPCVEMLLDKWNFVFENIQKDMEERLAKKIKTRINDCKDKTEELDRKLERYE